MNCWWMDSRHFSIADSSSSPVSENKELFCLSMAIRFILCCFCNRFFFLWRGLASIIISSNSKVGSQLSWSLGGIKLGVTCRRSTASKSIWANAEHSFSSLILVIRPFGSGFKSLLIAFCIECDICDGSVGHSDLCIWSTWFSGVVEWISYGRWPHSISNAQQPSDHQSAYRPKQNIITFITITIFNGFSFAKKCDNKPSLCVRLQWVYCVIELFKRED